MVMPMDEAFNAYNAERLRAADTLLLGRPTFEGFKSFWPSVAEDPKVRPVLREISRRDNKIEKVVVSDSLPPEHTAPWQASTRILRRSEANPEIAEMKRRTGGEILVFGSRTTMERPAGPWPGRRASSDDRVRCSRQGHADIRA
jgi:dihydrofolate reductase